MKRIYTSAIVLLILILPYFSATHGMLEAAETGTCVPIVCSETVIVLHDYQQGE